MAEQTQAAVLEAPRRFRIVERRRPSPGPGEVVVRIAATAVCHTDLSIYTGDHPGVRYPVVLGHESTGTVAAVGEGVAGLASGQGAIINPIIACGRCDMCARGAENLCRNAGLMGREVEGSLNQYLRIPSRYVHALPGHLPLAQATLIETLATVRHAQQRLGLKANESVVVLGQGTSGLLHARLAVLSGANPVIAISRSRWKLDRAIAMGAHHALDTGAEHAVDEVLRLTGGAGADAVIDTAGGAAAPRAGGGMLRPGGRFSPVSIHHARAAGLHLFPFFYKGISGIGSRARRPGNKRPRTRLSSPRA